MGLIEQVQEAARRARAGDDWFFKEAPYVLQVTCSTFGNQFGVADMSLVLPLGPEQYRVKHVYRQSVTPTLGGLIAEERGLLWREVTVSGTFGLEPKSPASLHDGLSYADTTVGPDFPVPLAFEKLSGPAWTRRMVRNLFGRYADLKSDPACAADTRLIWHDLRTGDSWVCVPIEVDVDRTVARRLQHPWTFTLKAVGDANAVMIPRSPASLFTKITNAIAAVGKALDTISAALDEGTAILGEVRYFVATIDSVIDKVTTIVAAGRTFVEGVTSTMSVGASFVSSTAALLQECLDTMETIDELPIEVRHNYQQALDGLHAIGAQLAAFGTTYENETAAIARAEAGAAGDDQDELDEAAGQRPPSNANDWATQRTRSTDAALVAAGALPEGRTIESYLDVVRYPVAAGDTLQSIAARFLGSGDRWWDIAVYNALAAPYITQAGAPDTAVVGDILAIPIPRSLAGAAIVNRRETLSDVDRFGSNMRLQPTPASQPGRPSVTLQIDRRTYKDVAIVSGVDNLTQALQMRLWTQRGTMPLIPDYGLDAQIGSRQSSAFIALLSLNIRKAIGQDSRVQSIRAIRTAVTLDVVDFDIDVVPIGGEDVQSLQLAVV